MNRATLIDGLKLATLLGLMYAMYQLFLFSVPYLQTLKH